MFRLAERLDPRFEVVTTGFDPLLERLEPGQSVAIQIAVSPTAIGKPITPEDIYQDVVLDNLGMDHRFIVDNYLNAHARRLAGGIPFYKYIAGLGSDVGKAIELYRQEFDALDKFRTESIRGGMESKHRRFAGYTSVPGLLGYVPRKGPSGSYPICMTMRLTSTSSKTYSSAPCSKLGTGRQNVWSC